MLCARARHPDSSSNASLRMLKLNFLSSHSRLSSSLCNTVTRPCACTRHRCSTLRGHRCQVKHLPLSSVASRDFFARTPSIIMSSSSSSASATPSRELDALLLHLRRVERVRDSHLSSPILARHKKNDYTHALTRASKTLPIREEMSRKKTGGRGEIQGCRSHRQC
eukprot:1341798-Rhodomonas_salina.2